MVCFTLNINFDPEDYIRTKSIMLLYKKSSYRKRVEIR